MKTLFRGVLHTYCIQVMKAIFSFAAYVVYEITHPKCEKKISEKKTSL